MDSKGFGHVTLFGRLQESGQILDGCIFVVMTTATCIGLLFFAAVFHGEFREHEPKGMAVPTAGFADINHPGHMAADTTPKGMNPVDRTILWGRMTAFA